MLGARKLFRPKAPEESTHGTGKREEKEKLGAWFLPTPQDLSRELEDLRSLPEDERNKEREGEIEKVLEFLAEKKKNAEAREKKYALDDMHKENLPNQEIPETDLIGGRYEKLSRIGEGGMGEVWLARDVKTSQEVVLKWLHLDLTRHEHAIKRFKREIKILGRLKSPFITSAHTAEMDPRVLEDHIRKEKRRNPGLDDAEAKERAEKFLEEQGKDGLVLAMEKIEGKDLFDTLRDEKYFDDTKAAKVVLQICLAFDAAHKAGIVHRDFKPENVFLQETDEPDSPLVRVGDFGISGFMDDIAKEEFDTEGVERTPIEGRQKKLAKGLTAIGTVFGTPEYIPPEQARGMRVDGRADLYALGIVMFRMMVGNLPFRGGNKRALIQRQISEPPPKFQYMDMPEGNEDSCLLNIVTKLLEKNPDDRFPSAMIVAKLIKAKMEAKASARLEELPKKIDLLEKEIHGMEEEVGELSGGARFTKERDIINRKDRVSRLEKSIENWKRVSDNEEPYVWIGELTEQERQEYKYILEDTEKVEEGIDDERRQAVA